MHEVSIVGCGPVGLTLANCLKKSPIISKVLLIDKNKPKILTNQHESNVPNQRVYSLNKPTLDLLKNLNIYEKLKLKGKMKSLQVASSQSGSKFYISDNQAEIVENNQLVSAAFQTVTEGQGSQKIQFVEGSLKDFHNGEQSIKMQIQGNTVKHFQTKLLVGSDGNQSRVKQIANIATYGWSYQQKAIVCTMEYQSLKECTIGNQIYHDNGNILALLPLWSNYVSLVWSLNMPEFEYLSSLSEDRFINKINTVISQANQKLHLSNKYIQIDSIKKLSNQRMSFPLQTLQSGSYVKERLALIGDAAHTIHPMAGLGVNSGIMDASLLANNILRNIKAGHDIGEPLSLKKYSETSKAFNYSNSVAMEAIKKAFQINNGPFNWARSQAMSFIDQSDAIKTVVRNLTQKHPILEQKNYEWDH